MVVCSFLCHNIASLHGNITLSHSPFTLSHSRQRRSGGGVWMKGRGGGVLKSTTQLLWHGWWHFSCWKELLVRWLCSVSAARKRFFRRCLVAFPSMANCRRNKLDSGASFLTVPYGPEGVNSHSHTHTHSHTHKSCRPPFDSISYTHTHTLPSGIMRGLAMEVAHPTSPSSVLESRLPFFIMLQWM